MHTYRIQSGHKIYIKLYNSEMWIKKEEEKYEFIFENKMKEKFMLHGNFSLFLAWGNFNKHEAFIVIWEWDDDDGDGDGDDDDVDGDGDVAFRRSIRTKMNKRDILDTTLNWSITMETSGISFIQPSQP